MKFWIDKTWKSCLNFPFILVPHCLPSWISWHHEFPSQRPVMGNFDVFFDLCLNKQLSKQVRHQWFEMPLHSLSCHCNDPLKFAFSFNSGLIEHSSNLWYQNLPIYSIFTKSQLNHPFHSFRVKNDFPKWLLFKNWYTPFPTTPKFSLFHMNPAPSNWHWILSIFSSASQIYWWVISSDISINAYNNVLLFASFGRN